MTQTRPNTTRTAYRAPLIAFAALALVVGCSQDEDEPTNTAPSMDEEESTDQEESDLEAEDETAGADTEEGDDAETSSDEDFIHILAKHAPEKPDDPVKVELESFSVKEASFDPENLEGGEAELEIDLSSLKSGDGERDEHLQSPDYLNVEEYPKADVSIGDVEQIEEDLYDATAEVSVHGVTTTWPLELEVLERKEDAIRVRAEHSFDRMDFEVGKEKTGEDADPVARDMSLEAELTVSPSS